MKKLNRPELGKKFIWDTPNCHQFLAKTNSCAQIASGLAQTPPRRSENERAHTSGTLDVPRAQMRAGSQKKYLAAQNAGERARTPPWKIDAPRMRAGTHKRYLVRRMQAEWMPNAGTRGWISPRRAPPRDPQESMRVSLKAAWNRSSNFSSNFFYAAKENEKKNG